MAKVDEYTHGTAKPSGPGLPGVEMFQMWPTNLMTRQLDLSQDDNESLASAATAFSRQHSNHAARFAHRDDTDCFFSSTPGLPAAARLFQRVRETAYLYLASFYPEVPLTDVEPLFSSFASVQDREKLWILPHAHVESQFVLTYYCQVARGPAENPDHLPGVLNFHDPRPLMANWMVRKERKLLSVNVTTGTLVVFPGYVQHSTGPFFDETSNKVAIVTNVRLFEKKDIARGRHRTAEEIMEAQNHVR